MARTRSRSSARSGRLGRHAPVGAIEFFTRPEQHIVWQVLGFLVRIRAELLVTAVFVTVAVTLREQIGPDPAFLTLAATTLVVFAVPASRRYMVRRMWCVTTRHRMRACFSQTRTMTHHGRMPFLVWSRPSPVGERIRVWLPAGLSVKDIEHAAPELAAACWARETRITPTRWQAALVVVDIVRRDPLGTKTVLEPTVLDNLDDNFDDEHDTEHDTGTGATVVPLPDRANLPPAPADTPAATGTTGNGSGPRRKTPATSTGPARTENDTPEPAVTGFGGVDVSDYV